MNGQLNNNKYRVWCDDWDEMMVSWLNDHVLAELTDRRLCYIRLSLDFHVSIWRALHEFPAGRIQICTGHKWWGPASEFRKWSKRYTPRAVSPMVDASLWWCTDAFRQFSSFFCWGKGSQLSIRGRVLRLRSTLTHLHWTASTNQPMFE